ncbi:substrate-binding domain-containing protein [Naasia lichenicola]|uniref:Sugar ABC transporter substrate-binding protein n=1 Tax=Naasia lichenicola TaxID=2565933 RepID=A0A4S4FMT7_9MICO|nr:substrate-binding domain-containing protein [Naasia lichenicola]THG31571.1 sugar ABC transporter substrate-binding protein [Naasia lichenicola]
MHLKKRLGIVAVGLTILTVSACSSGTVGEAEGSTGDATAASTDYSSIIPSGDIVAASKEIVETSLTASEGFTPPSTGAEAQKPGAKIAYVAADLTDGGPNGVGVGLAEAAAVIGWTVDVYDGQGTAQGHTDAINNAIASIPDAIILGSVDAIEQASTIKAATAAGIPVFGWHSNAEPGPGEGLETNISTDPLQVAQLAAAYAVADSDGTAGAVIFTDSQYAVAIAKSDAMKAYLEACTGCSVLSVEDSPISATAQRMPGLISSLLQENGDKLTYLLGINGNYFTGAAPALQSAGKDPAGPPNGIAAGNGDAAELQRIRTGQYQKATVAEPLYLQAWQLIDAVNDSLAGTEIPDFVAAPGLIDASNVPQTGDVFDPESGYRDVYREIWGK